MVPGWYSDAASVLTAGANELKERLRTMGIEKQQVRLNSGILTDKEASNATGLRLWQVRRAVALGKIPYHRTGEGRLIVYQHDLPRLTSISDWPATHDGWFDTRQLLDVRYFGPRVTTSPRNAFTKHGTAVFRGEAYAFADYALRRGSQRYGFPAGSQRSLEMLYAGGPDRFRTFLADCESKLAGLRYVHGGQSLSFANLAGYNAATMIHTTVKEAF